MALTATLYRFQIELSDITRGVYETLSFRLAQHPSESTDYMLTRVIAYALSYDQDLEFSAQGLSDPDVPALSSPNPQGGYKMWIEIGNPSARKLHKASKASRSMRVFTYKDPNALLREMNGVDIHRKNEIEVYSVDPKALAVLQENVARDNRWAFLYNEGLLSISYDGKSIDLEITKHQ